MLKKQGYEVIGGTLELFKSNIINNDAKIVCDLLDIPHMFFDYQSDFKKYVINDFIECYANCITPNPCIECNKYMKFGLMYQKAEEIRL